MPWTIDLGLLNQHGISFKWKRDTRGIHKKWNKIGPTTNILKFCKVEKHRDLSIIRNRVGHIFWTYSICEIYITHMFWAGCWQWIYLLHDQWFLTTTLDMIFSVWLYLVLFTPCSTLIFYSLIFSVKHKCATAFRVATSFLLLSLLHFLYILTNTKFVHVTSTYYHS